MGGWRRRHASNLAIFSFSSSRRGLNVNSFHFCSVLESLGTRRLCSTLSIKEAICDHVYL